MKRSFLGVAVFSLLFLLAAGCEQKDLGRYCVVGFDPSTGGNGVKAINPEAPECIERLCVLQSRVVTVDNEEQNQTVQYCSQKCGSDGECKGGDKPEHCDSGFVCVRLGEGTGQLNGKCICECRDFLTEADLCLSRCKNSDREKDQDCGASGE